MLIDEIKKELFQLQDTKYRDFQARLIPTVPASAIIGVRTPQLRKLAKQMAKRDGMELFLDQLPHQYFDENQLHAFIISDIRDFGQCVDQVGRFLPFIDNWATCDQLSPKVFKKNRQELLAYIKGWIASGQTYVVRFAIGMLMEHFLDEGFDIAYPEMVSQVHSEEYYINMMAAWYFATALAKQYDATLPFIEGMRLEPWVHNKAIQKSVESNRIPPERKAYLKTLKVSK